MAVWFQKNELRRFPRIDMPVRLFITPEKPIRTLEIFALGIDYFPSSVSKQIKHNHKQFTYWVRHIQEQKDILEPVFLQIMDAAQILGKSVEMISVGRSPLNDEEMAEKISINLKTIGNISGLEEPAPKTHNYLFELEKKLTHFYRLLFISLHKSTSQNYHSFNPTGHQFKIDEMTSRFDQPAYQKIPLIQAINFMNKLVSNYCEAFQELNLDYYSLDNPKAWKRSKVNLSSGGIAALYPKRFLPGKPLMSKMYFDGHNRVMEVKTVFARSEPKHEESAEMNAFYFEFPHAQDQTFLTMEIERYQVERITALCKQKQSIERAG